MLVEAIKGEERRQDLNGVKNILLGAFATSLDAFAVGVSLSLSGAQSGDLAVNLATLFVVTFLVVTLGVFGGSKIGQRFGRPAEILGGIVLVLIGVGVLIGII